MLHQFYSSFGHLVDKRLVQPQPAPEKRSAAQQPPQHIAPPLVAGHNSVGDEKSNAAAVLGNHPDGVIIFIIRAILLARKLGDTLYQRRKEVDLIDRGFIIDRRRRPLQPHSCVDIGLGQRSALALLVLVILGEDQVPDFGKAPAVAVGSAGRLTAADILAEVIVNLAAGPTGTAISGGPPVVVLLPEAQYSILGDTHPPPVAEGLVVVEVDGYPQTFRGQLQALGDELPRPANRLFFEVVADAEVAQHLEKGEVCGIAHRLDIGGAEAFLTGSQTGVGWLCLPQEVGLERHHARRGQKQGGVAPGYQGRAGDDFMLFFLEKV
ncbi:hypothetical protein ES703_78151 [subsurface metagenome]